MGAGTSIWVECELELWLIEKEGFAKADAKITSQREGLDYYAGLIDVQNTRFREAKAV